jgi:hypothetical protein
LGTNYFLRRKIESENDRKVLDKYGVKLLDIHIGKSSYGWPFHFKAHEGIEQNLPVKIESFKALRSYLDSGNYEVYDEYEAENSVDEFVELVLCKQRDNALESSYVNEGDSFLDPEGYHFFYSEFS